MLKLTDITWLYHHLPMRFSLTVERGEQVAILGPSGAGKSTLLNLIAGFLTPASGSLTIDGVDHTTTPPSRRPVSMLFQENNLFSHLTVAQNIGLGLNPGLKLNSAQQEKMHAIARQMGIDNLMARLPGELSGGQRQRVALARCLVREQPILLLDEPFLCARSGVTPGDVDASEHELPTAKNDAIDGVAQCGRCGADRHALGGGRRRAHRLAG